MTIHFNSIPRFYVILLLFWVLYSFILVFASIGLSDSHTLDTLLLLPLLLQLPIYFIGSYFFIPRFLKKGHITNYIGFCAIFSIFLMLLLWGYYSMLAKYIPNHFDMTIIDFSLFLPPVYAPEMLIINFFSILVLCLCGIIFYFYEDNRHKERREMQLIASAQESKLQFLKNQINPHFLFNVLNNIYSLSMIQSKKTPESILQLSSMLRYVLYECNNETVPIQEEIKYIASYVELIKLKDDRINNIHFEHNIQKQITIAPMIFIPFIENSFKHSNFEDIEKGWINISLRSEMNRIVFACENGISTNKLSKDEVGGIGIRNVKNRLHAIYPNRHTLSIEEAKNSYHVMLTIYPKPFSS